MQLELYLTFDDGPSAEYTPALLDLLKKYEIKASFFMVAVFAQTYPEIVERMQREGHYIGLHSLRHKSAYLMTPRETRSDFVSGKRILRDIGVDVKGYRPPWGHLTPWAKKYAAQQDLKVILWDVMAEDWRGDTSKEEIKEKLLERTFSGAAICLHDGRGKDHAPARMLQALEEVIPKWLEAGYQFKRVDEGYEDKDM